MNAAQQTSEQWHMRPMSDESGWIVAFQEGPGPRVLMPKGPPDWRTEERARLVAAAPDLLAACEAVESKVQWIGCNDLALRDMLRAAIAKAKGGAA